MLNHVTISGYKSLQGSTARFSPFTVIVGRNNTGKSNLFDALRLLSNLAQMPAASAFKPERHRGDPVESFFSEQQPRLSMACDLDLAGTPHPFSRIPHCLTRFCATSWTLCSGKAWSKFNLKSSKVAHRPARNFAPLSPWTRTARVASRSTATRPNPASRVTFRPPRRAPS